MREKKKKVPTKNRQFETRSLPSITKVQTEVTAVGRKEECALGERLSYIAQQGLSRMRHTASVLLQSGEPQESGAGGWW